MTGGAEEDGWRIVSSPRPTALAARRVNEEETVCWRSLPGGAALATSPGRTTKVSPARDIKLSSEKFSLRGEPQKSLPRIPSNLDRSKVAGSEKRATKVSRGETPCAPSENRTTEVSLGRRGVFQCNCEESEKGVTGEIAIDPFKRNRVFKGAGQKSLPGRGFCAHPSTKLFAGAQNVE